MHQLRALELAERFARMRERTLALVAPLSDDDLGKVHEPTMGPVNWDLAHIAHFEAQWLVHGIHGDEAREKAYDPTYDAEKQPRPTRDKLGVPDRAGCIRYLSEVHEVMLQELNHADLENGDPIVRDGFAHEMLLNHEAQHQENMLVTLQMIPGRYRPAVRALKPLPRKTVGGMAFVPGGTFPLGADLAPGVYDNEAPCHEVAVPAFRIARAPVTNGEYLKFVEAGGYEDDTCWHEDGAILKAVKKWRRPKYWFQRSDGAWWTRQYDREMPLPLDEPVVHVSWYEADAYARWKGKRLPTEAEWEKACTWDPATLTKRTYPWGDKTWTPDKANLGQRLWGTAPVGAYPAGASPVGCHQMVGDTWEWTASDFTAYPGFEAFPYPEYSTPFFDRGFKVLRGGSWATHAEVARGTFRNWHQPDHQQIFAGFRLAEDAEGAAP